MSIKVKRLVSSLITRILNQARIDKDVIGRYRPKIVFIFVKTSRVECRDVTVSFLVGKIREPVLVEHDISAEREITVIPVLQDRFELVRERHVRVFDGTVPIGVTGPGSGKVIFRSRESVFSKFPTEHVPVPVSFEAELDPAFVAYGLPQLILARYGYLRVVNPCPSVGSGSDKVD
jgi:hypothetical protein